MVSFCCLRVDYAGVVEVVVCCCWNVEVVGVYVCFVYVSSCT